LRESLLHAVSQKGFGPDEEPHEPFRRAINMIKAGITKNLIADSLVQTKIGIALEMWRGNLGGGRSTTFSV
jgi:hypothetical protein